MANPPTSRSRRPPPGRLRWAGLLLGLVGVPSASAHYPHDQAYWVAVSPDPSAPLLFTSLERIELTLFGRSTMTFSENAQYLIVHTPTSSFYEDDTKLWDKSYPAKVMDMFEATDMDMPVCDNNLVHAMKTRQTDLPEALQSAATTDEQLHAEVSRWFRKVAVSLDSVRKYLFGDAFLPAVAVKAPVADAPKKVRKSRHRELDEAMAAA